MELLLGGISSLFGGGGAAAGTTWAAANAGVAAAAPAAGAAASGLSLSSILQGTASVLGVLSSVGAGQAEATQMELAAQDAESEQAPETLQGINRRQSLRRQFADAIGAQDVAYAASGADLSFGTASAARKDAYREADLGLTMATGTEQTRVSRLAERAANYRAGAKQAKRAGWLNGLIGGINTLQSFSQRGGY